MYNWQHEDWLNFKYTTTEIEEKLFEFKLVSFTLRKARFFDLHRNSLNEHQLKVVNRMLDEETGGFKGSMTAKKYIALTITSKAKATRPSGFVSKKLFVSIGDGRTRY
ncbi:MULTISPECIES: hypothetical protein [unclassified Leeuwenhoekiella]|uniref:hypothetical protein n=1 Tax=unclassified Leeuwenhoekiella TaxID=2615029 RepID=UPI000C0E5B54|nr:MULTISPECIES: hypothetical protein [unclassified Leeuwenhoekiella]MAS71540.1 hypothetical protein [Zunongwangia sp.]MAW96279.1 hypothetical protein [Leeuwenhoekiella sp.]MBA82770.1 hypothetical protein [Leeuwenhoekiella sp.]PHR98544.1 MAG: hypothetical protein COA80_05155 [Leeuwenhoekiella sp.]|tara:strand:- start:1615 stop:1938 length:324 start_codon:yes stop_codon:yes gene_type:complete